MPFSNNYANNILNFIFSTSTNALVPPDAVYIGLCTNDPEADGGVFTELVNDDYKRVWVSHKTYNYPELIGAAEDRSITNIKQINWAKATSDWETVKGFGLFSAETGGEPFFYGTLEDPVTCVAGAVALFDPAALKISFPTEDV